VKIQGEEEEGGVCGEREGRKESLQKIKENRKGDRRKNTKF
jgi:hypothetical protein